MSDLVMQELLRLNQQLLDSIAHSDWKQYQELCDPTLTCFEPEAMGQLVEGMEFHHFYFQLRTTPPPHNTTMTSPHVRVMGDVAIISYVRLNQRVLPDGSPVTRAFEETRVWQKQNGAWKHVHFHRSTPTK
jgi:calcium/calmodulin-dependent protein kinase (CaM kinase) II